EGSGPPAGTPGRRRLACSADSSFRFRSEPEFGTGANQQGHVNPADLDYCLAVAAVVLIRRELNLT
ncbi:MAG TPA: hypothetical protein P5057_00615, partial [Acidobacteriota bacterium]|nr:hypothetical protein [Acidobacteriota bacterium]